MEEGLIALAVILLLAVSVIPFVALGLVIGARKRIARLEEEVAARQRELRYLYDEMNRERNAAHAQGAAAGHPSAAPTAAATNFAAVTAALGVSAGAGPAGAMNIAPPTGVPKAMAAGAGPAGATNIAPRAGVSEAMAGGAGPVGATNIAPGAGVPEATAAGAGPAGATNIAPRAGVPEAMAGGAGPVGATNIAPGAGVHEATATGPGSGPPGPQPPGPPPPRFIAPRSPPPSVPFEQRLATYFTRIGAGALLLGVLYFYKYAVDSEWIGPAGRVLTGTLVGAFVLVFAEVIRAKTRPPYVHAVVGVGLACLFISAYASSAFYHLVDAPTAFGANAVILFLGAALAWRYRGEAVLVVVLVAGFLNPVLLSTGKDLPLPLFSYLSLLTAVTLVVSVKKDFAIALPLSIAGVVVLFVGWYMRYFDVRDNRGAGNVLDLPAEKLVGAYHEMQSRAVPLAFVALFTALWLATAFVLRKENRLPFWVRPVAVAALVLSHAGASALLHDHPRIQGGVMIAFGALAIASLRALEATRLLLVPMLSAFLILAGINVATETDQHLVLLIILSLWSAIYVAAFLKDASDRHREIGKADGLRAGVAIFAFGALAALILLPADKLYSTAIVMAVASVALCMIAIRARVVSLIMVALFLSFGAMMVAANLTAPSKNHADPTFLAIALLWSAVYAGSILRAVHKRRESSWAGLMILSLAGLMFLAVALVSTSPDSPTLRALLTAAIGAADLAFAAYIRRARPELQAWVTILSAQALGLFVPAVAFGLSGSTITVVWAVLTAVSVLILAESRQKTWLAVAITLALLTLFRVFAFDFDAVEAQLRAFEYSGGRTGVLQAPTFFNQRAYALLGTGLAFLGGALALVRGSKKFSPADETGPATLRAFAPVLATIAYGLITLLAIIEIRSALLTLPPPPPMPLDADEFNAFMQSIQEAKAAHRNLLAMSSTLVLAVVATILLGIGFAAKDPFHRYLGLALFLGTVAKLAVWDVWNLGKIYQVIVLSAVGALLLGCGFLYARLKTLFREGTAAITILFALTAVGLDARAEEPAPPPVRTHLFQHMRPILGIEAPGDYRVPIDLDLYRKSASPQLLDDVRIADPAGHEVPYVVRAIPASRPIIPITPRMLDPGEIEGGGYRALFELAPAVEHCEVQLDVSHPSPFLRRTRIETGEKPKDLQLVSSGSIVYAVDAGGLHSENLAIRYPSSIARYVRVTLLPDRNAQLTVIQGAKFSCTVPAALPPVETLPLQITGTSRNADQKTTELDLDAGSEGVPIQTLHLEIANKELVRSVEIKASSFKSAWPIAGSAVIFRVAGPTGSTGGTGSESTSIHLSQQLRKRWLKLIIHDGDDAPLEITGVRATLPKREIILRTPSAGAHALYTGDKTGATPRPTYELAAILDRRTTPLDAKPATFDRFVENPTFGKEEKPNLPVTERYRAPIGIALVVLLIALAFWAVKLMRAQSPEPDSTEPKESGPNRAA